MGENSYFSIVVIFPPTFPGKKSLRLWGDNDDFEGRASMARKSQLQKPKLMLLRLA
ncbi:hypothetical protein [Sphingomonas sp. ID0503]|uniref:hypothetical protein n=1 Tax=Sphingomonas sp. ID0503 TaxID=3399691 RepID=UPI003AFB4C79